MGRLRVGQCTSKDLNEIRKLIIGNPECPPTSFQTYPWSDAILVTTRHAVREAWNTASLNLHCHRTEHLKYIVPTEDYIKGPNPRSLTPIARLLVAGRGEKLTGKLGDRLELAIGMKVIVLLNLLTEADIANGTRGMIQDIVLDHREGRLLADDNGIVKLTYPPAMIVFKPNMRSNISSAFQDNRPGQSLVAPEGHVPIILSSTTFKIKTPDAQDLTIVRR